MSTLPSQSGKRERSAARTISSTVSIGALASIQISAWRGTMMSRSGRSAKRMTPSSSSRSAAWKTPASVPSAIIALTSSSVTALGAVAAHAQEAEHRLGGGARNQTIGVPMVASSVIGPETKAAMPSALRSARRLGTARR